MLSEARFHDLAREGYCSNNWVLLVSLLWAGGCVLFLLSLLLITCGLYERNIKRLLYKAESNQQSQGLAFIELLSEAAVSQPFFLFFKLINLFYFTILYWFCRTLTWILHGCTCVPHPEPPSHLPPQPIPLGHPSAPAPSILSHALNLDWLHIW